MIMSPVGRGPENDCAGEDQQQLWTTEPSSCQSGSPILTNPQLSDAEGKIFHALHKRVWHQDILGDLTSVVIKLWRCLRKSSVLKRQPHSVAYKGSDCWQNSCEWGTVTGREHTRRERLLLEAVAIGLVKTRLTDWYEKWCHKLLDWIDQ
jgi:hypothetical protein